MGRRLRQSTCVYVNTLVHDRFVRCCTPTDRARRECIVYPNKFSGVLAHLYKDWPSAQAASIMCEHKRETQQHLTGGRRKRCAVTRAFT